MTEPLYPTPNTEALVSAFLRDQPELVDVIDDRVYTKIPKGATYPLVRVTLLLDTPSGSPLWLTAAEIQVEAFGGSNSEAYRIATIARAAIDQRLTGGVHAEGVVTGTSPGPMLDLPDETFTPAKPRWLFTSTIHVHPGSSLPS